ncbi:MAG: dihydrodipicolinate synthase family protein, partial [Dehalococcoidia bacterium]
MEPLSGVITSMLTPFTDSYSLDEETLAQELEYQISKDVHGICVLGGTGESLSLTAEERLRVVEVAAQVVKGRVPLVVGSFVPRE